MANLHGKAALITGGGSGIGRAIAESFAAAGAAVLLGDTNLANATAVAEAINETGGRALDWPLDVRDPAACAGAVRAALDWFGQLDILVNSAGIGGGGLFRETTLEDWQNVLAVNLTGTFLCSQEAARVMVEAGRGRIINIASVSGQLGGHRRAAYGASKGGVIMLTRTMATELATLGVTVNAIAPGPIDTPMTAAMHGPERAAWLARLPMHRYGTPAEVAAAALFLASDEASFVTGHVLNVDGGFAAAGIFTPPE